MERSYKKLTRRPSSGANKQQGVVLVYTALAMVAIIGVAALSVDVSWLYDRQAAAQRAADAAAIAGDWHLAHNDTDAVATASANAIAAANGYDAAHVTVTTTYAGDSRNLHVRVWHDEPTFFSYLFGKKSQVVSAAATAAFPSYNQLSFDPKFYGQASGPYNLSSYGPDNGATRGDEVNTRWLDIANSKTLTPNPLNTTTDNPPKPLDTGEDYFLTVPSNYATSAGTSQMAVQIYDPDLYASPVPGANTMDELSYHTPTEKWRYTLYHVNSNGTKTQIAYKTYGEGDPDQVNTDGRWVTPAGFTVDTSAYSGGNFVVNVRTDDGYGNPGTGKDENGYLLRAGKPFPSSSAYHPTDATNTLRTDLVDPNNPNTTDATWLKDYSAGTGMGAISNLVIYANGLGGLSKPQAIQIYFGYAPANPVGDTTITFIGFDEDTGASDIYYTCDQYPGLQFKGIVAPNNTGNGLPSVTGPTDRGVNNPTEASNTVFFPAGTYHGGNWTAWYTTGAHDCTTWSWTTNYKTPTNYGIPHLIYTDPTKIY